MKPKNSRMKRKIVLENPETLDFLFVVVTRHPNPIRFRTNMSEGG
jgi:hypothetical protein